MTVGCFLKIILKDYTDYGFRIWHGSEFKAGDKYSSPQYSDDEEPAARLMEDFADYEIVNGSIEVYVRHNRPWIEMKVENLIKIEDNTNCEKITEVDRHVIFADKDGYFL